MSRFFDVIVLAFLFASLALPVSLQAQHHGGFHRGPTATITVRPPAAGRGPEFVGTPVAPFINSPVTSFIGGIVTPFVGRPVTPPVITTPHHLPSVHVRFSELTPVAVAPVLGYGYGYYSPYIWPAPVLAGPAYAQSAYVLPSETAAVSQTAADLSYQVRRLSQEIEDLRQQQAAQAQRLAQPEAPEASTPVVLIFRDGHRLEIQNYAIIGQTLWVFHERDSVKILLAELDLSATEWENRARSMRFSLPSTK